MTDFTIGERGPISANSRYSDEVLQAGGIAVDENDYSTTPDSTVLDRVYDVKGLNNMHVEIENTGGANGLTYKIENCRKAYDDLTTLVEADFDQDLKGDTDVAFGDISISDIIDISPETTAIRIKIKRESAGDDTTLAGIVSVN